MEQRKHDFYDKHINAALIINKRIVDNVEEKEYVRHIETYVRNVDNLYIYNITNQDLSSFYEKLSKYDNVLYTEMEDYGQVQNYQFILEHFLDTKCDFGVILELGYYYEEDAFLTLRRYVTENDSSKMAIVTPLPLRGCELFLTNVEDVRNCKGCNMVGTLINMKIFEELSPLKLEYYQSMFDYEYCLRARHNGYNIVLLQNQVLRNQNYTSIERKVFMVTLTTYDYDLMDLYYQTRNRFYLWDEYKDIDPAYIKLDKKLYRGERHVMKVRDRNYRDKFYMMNEAQYDYLKGKKGKYNGGNKNEEN